MTAFQKLEISTSATALIQIHILELSLQQNTIKTGAYFKFAFKTRKQYKADAYFSYQRIADHMIYLGLFDLLLDSAESAFDLVFGRLNNFLIKNNQKIESIKCMDHSPFLSKNELQSILKKYKLTIKIS